MSDEDESFRAMKTEKGVSTVGCNVTPVGPGHEYEPPLPKLPDNFGSPVMAFSQREHWLDAEDRKMAELTAKLASRGFDFSGWASGSVSGKSFELDFAVATLTMIERIEARIAKLEAKPDA